MQCPFCEAYGVERLFLASLDLDVCACDACGARWDEHRRNGGYAGRGTRASVLAPRDH
jgi:hypothetical protein